MSAWKVAFRLWLASIVINAVIAGIALIFDVGIMSIPAMIVLIIAGLLTFPLILLIFLFLRVYIFLPNSIPAKMSWLTFMLILLVTCFYAALAVSFTGSIYELDRTFLLFGFATCFAVTLAVVFSKKMLITLNNQSHEQCLV